MLVDLNVKFKALDGQELEEEILGKVLANRLSLVKSDKIPALKCMPWAEKLYAGETLELDQVDFDLLKEYVVKNAQLTPLAEYQILRRMENQTA